jgi:hypothetical protein
MEWLGHERDCLQLVARFGGLAKRPGERTATFIPTTGGNPISYSAAAVAGGRITADVLDLLHEPHPTLRAAGLVPSFARGLEIARVTSDSFWLTSNHPVAHAMLHTFQVLDRLPLDRKKVRVHLRDQGWKAVEVKSRDAAARPESLLRDWRQDDGEPVCLIVLRVGGRLMVYVTKRV